MNKRKLPILAVCLAVISGATAQTQDLKITVTNIRNDRGFVLMALHKPGKNFIGERFMSVKLTAQKGQVAGVFSNVPPGTYAVSVIHDANGDMKFNKNFFGKPVEGLGFSNNAVVKSVPPDFQEVSFEFPKRNEMIVALKYW